MPQTVHRPVWVDVVVQPDSTCADVIAREVKMTAMEEILGICMLDEV